MFIYCCLFDYVKYNIHICVYIYIYIIEPNPTIRTYNCIDPRASTLNSKPFSILFSGNFGPKNTETLAFFCGVGGVLSSYGDYHRRRP